MQGLTLLQEAVKRRPRPYSWLVGDDGGVGKFEPSQRDALTPERMRATTLDEPTGVGDAPLSKDLLGKARQPSRSRQTRK